MSVFVSLGCLTRYDFFLVLSICLEISRCHYFLSLSSTPLCKYTTFSLSILQLRASRCNSTMYGNLHKHTTEEKGLCEIVISSLPGMSEIGFFS